MRSISSTTLLVLAAGLAQPSALAQPLAPASRTDFRAERTPLPAATAPRAADFRGEFASMRDELENFTPGANLGAPGVAAPPTSTVVPDGFDWGLNNLRGQAAAADYVRVVDLAGSPVGGNATQALRVRTVAAQNPGGFFLGGALRWGTAIGPSGDTNVRVSSELYISTIAEQYTFEQVSDLSGLVVARLLWGGTCVDLGSSDCSGSGLPTGPVSTIYSLFDNGSFGSGAFTPARFCTTILGQPVPGCTPPAGFASGDLVPPPIAAWARFTAQISADNNLTYFIDYLNGEPEVAIHSQFPATSPPITRVQWNTAFESQDAFLLVDNIEVSGGLFPVISPPPLECPYLDDLKWLNTGPLLGQNARWFAALSSAATVLNDDAQGRVISQVNNVSSNDQHRLELSTLLPASATTLANDLVASVAVRITGSAVRSFALFNGADLAARVTFNRFLTDSLSFDGGVFVQIYPAYDPIDPFFEPVDTNIPVVGVDIADTGIDWAPGDYRTLEIRLSASGALRVSIDGQRIYTGVGAFSQGVDSFHFESENNTLAPNSSLRIGDIALTCDAPSCATDFDFDDMTTFADLNAVLSSFGAEGLTGFTPGDANADGEVNFADLNAVLAAFGTSCQ